MKILVTGGSGYLGQFVVKALSSSHDVALGYNRRAFSDAEISELGNPLQFQLNLESGSGFHEVLERFGQPEIIINCAAISIPRECEKEPKLAESINIPTDILEWLMSFISKRPPLLVHLSTDQGKLMIYAGTKSFYSEEDETVPVNTYGTTKVKAEKLIREKWPNYVILRSSIIIGPFAPVSLSKGLPLQWMDSVLASSTPTEFFEDEFRCPIYVEDIVQLVKSIILRHTEGEVFHDIFNAGGPERLSRADMAERLAVVRGYDKSLVKRASSKSVNRGVQSPADISMNVSKAANNFGIKFTTFEHAITLSFN